MVTPLPVSPERYRDDLETIEADEAETAQDLSDTMLSITRKTFEDGGHAIRSVHAKSHGILHGTFEVLSGLPPVLAQGLFARPGTYEAVMRLSTTPGDILHDSVSTPRGIAVKLLGVSGERLPGDEGNTTQDFIAVNGKQFNTSSAKAFLRNLKLLAATTDRASWLKEIASKVFRGVEGVLEAVGNPSAALIAMGGQPEVHILGESFYGQLPIRYGDYVAKFAIVPANASLQALTGAPLDVDADPDALRHAVSDYFSGSDAVWDFQIQLCTDVKDMPVEDAAAVWDEEKSPFVTVARLRAPAQPSWNGSETERENDSLAFRPWNALAAHRPLGNIMRMRRLAYPQSQAFRSAHNAIPVSEPQARKPAAE